MNKSIFLNDYLIVRDSSKRVSFWDFPRTPDVGNNDFNISYKDNILDIDGSDGYSAVEAVRFVFEEKEKAISPILGGYEINDNPEETFQNIVECIIWALGLDNPNAIVTGYTEIEMAIESWDDFSWDEKFQIMREVIR